MVRPEDILVHRPPMLWLDEILDYGTEHLRARVRIDRDAPFVMANGVPGWMCLEYIAQSIAAFAGMRQRQQGNAPKEGLMLGTRSLELFRDVLPFDTDLTVHVQPLLGFDGDVNVFRAQVHDAEGVLVAQGDVKVFQADDMSDYLSPPPGRDPSSRADSRR